VSTRLATASRIVHSLVGALPPSGREADHMLTSFGNAALYKSERAFRATGQ